MRAGMTWMVAVVALASVTLGAVQEASAGPCPELFPNASPDCEETMGLCGAECSSCLLWDEYPDEDEHCAEMCADYGGAVSAGASTPYVMWGFEYWEIPGLVLVSCRCAWECPLYL